MCGIDWDIYSFNDELDKLVKAKICSSLSGGTKSCKRSESGTPDEGLMVNWSSITTEAIGLDEKRTRTQNPRCFHVKLAGARARGWQRQQASWNMCT